jgi:hypothetical protein
MGAKVEQEILVRIKTIVDGLNEVKSLSDSIKGLGGKNNGFKSLTGDAVKFGAAAGLTSAIVSKVADAAILLGTEGAKAFGSFVAEGIKFNATIESAKIGIATLVANTYDVHDAQGNLLDPVQSVQRIACKVRGTRARTSEVRYRNEVRVPRHPRLLQLDSHCVCRAKDQPRSTSALTQDFALAAGAANIESEKVRTGIQQILTGNVTVRNPLSRV